MWKQPQFLCLCEEQPHTLCCCDLKQLRVSKMWSTPPYSNSFQNMCCHRTRNSCKFLQKKVLLIFSHHSYYCTRFNQEDVHAAIQTERWTEKPNAHVTMWLDPTAAELSLRQHALCSAIHTFCCLAGLQVCRRTASQAEFAQHTTASANPLPTSHVWTLSKM